MDSNYFYSINNFSDLGFDIHDIYKIDELDSNVMDIQYGEWTQDGGLEIFQRNIWRRRANFKGHHLR